MDRLDPQKEPAARESGGFLAVTLRQHSGASWFATKPPGRSGDAARRALAAG